MQAAAIYDVTALPGATMYFRYDHFSHILGRAPVAGEEIAILVQREQLARSELTAQGFFPIATRATVREVVVDDHVAVHVESRVDVTQIEVSGDGLVEVEVVDRPDVDDLTDAEAASSLQRVRSTLLQFVSEYHMGAMARNFIMQFKSVGELYAASSNWLTISSEEKYEILATDSRAERLRRMESALHEMVEMQKVSSEAEVAQESEHKNSYREAAIKKQMEFLQEQLDELHPEDGGDVQRFERALAELEPVMNETAFKEASKVLTRMKQEGKNGHEYGMLYDYLDFVTGLAWTCPEMEQIDLDEAQGVLDEDHFGLEKVKRRILQHIAVMNLNRRQSGTILCFVGAPGTGKTSIGASIASALHRKYVRVSLGGVRDEADIRGHRRTYIGAMPGRVMDGIKKSGVANPVMVLDEIDKLAHDLHGDPASALLEVLDPEQNFSFTDHYMNAPYDLSNVLFICTANSVDTIPEPLLDRMEVIQFPGYTASDKLQIARRHLLPRAMEKTGVDEGALEVSDDVIRTIISDYTAEGGVRGLKKRLETLCRVAAVKLVKGDGAKVVVEKDDLREFLDAHPQHHEHILAKKRPGVVCGLAWTRAGGEILLVETAFTKGAGKVVITGKLGDVMKESAQIAISIVKGLFPEAAKKFETHDLHIHVPAGAVPKDGPSAGITLVTALSSLVNDKPVSPKIAMTGEVALRGTVMPIGGLPEKLMAAQRAGIKRVFIPRENVDDLEDVADEVKRGLKIVPVGEVRDVLEAVGILD